MTEEARNDDIHDGVGTYDVVVLVEHDLSAADAAQIRSLHEDVEDRVVYHVLLPQGDAAAQIEAALGSLGADDGSGEPDGGAGAERTLPEETGDDQIDATLAALRAHGASVRGRLVTTAPVDALAAEVGEVDAREAIILTRPHVVAEFFHLDWTSKARRTVGVPILHLLEHETFEEQAEGFGEEGVTGI